MTFYGYFQQKRDEVAVLHSWARTTNDKIHWESLYNYYSKILETFTVSEAQLLVE